MSYQRNLKLQHKDLASGRWFDFSFPAQMANIGSEVNRAINWKNKNNPEYSRQAFERSLELLYLTISDPKNKKRLRELTRVYEVLVDYFAFDNEYGSTDQSWQNYFFAFNYLSGIRYQVSGKEKREAMRQSKTFLFFLPAYLIPDIY